MVGITHWGVHIPIRRMSAQLLAERRGDGGPERSVAWSDEDSITMGVQAARNCIADVVRSEIDLVIFASTTHPFCEKQSGAIIAAALGLDSNVRSIDLSSSLRSGLQAIAIAKDSVASGFARRALVIAADCRQGAPGSELERSGGDAAAAFLIGSDGVVAQIIDTQSYTQEIQDVWRRQGDRFVHSWEDRFVTQCGVTEPLVKIAQKLPTSEGDRRWLSSAPNVRIAKSVAKAVDAQVEAVTQTVQQNVGYCGTAHAPLLLAGALEESRVGEEIAVLAHGDGAEALLVKVTSEAQQNGFSASLKRRLPVQSLAVWRKARNLDFTEYPAMDDQGISATIHYRERDANNRLQGQKCDCGTPQFPKGRVCGGCGVKDAFTPQDYSDRGGTLITYTLDAFFPSPTPPTVVGIVEVDDGPRIYLQVSEIAPDAIRLGMRLRFVFRRIHEVGKRPNYFWKSVPDWNCA